MATPEAQQSIPHAPDVSQLAQQGMPLDAFAHLLTGQQLIDEKRQTAIHLMVGGIRTTQTLNPDDETTMLRSFNLQAARYLELFVALTQQDRDVIVRIGEEVPGLTMEKLGEMIKTIESGKAIWPQDPPRTPQYHERRTKWLTAMTTIAGVDDENIRKKLAEVWNTTALRDQTPNPEDSIPKEEQPGFLMRMSHIDIIAHALQDKQMQQFAQASTIMEARPLTTWLEATHIRDLKSAKTLLMLEMREFAINPKRLTKELEKVVGNLERLFVVGYGFKTIEDALRQMDESHLFDDQKEELKQVVATLREYVQLHAANNESAT